MTLYAAPTMCCLQVPTLLVVVSVALLAAIVVMSVLVDPVLNGISCIVFFTGIPLYFLGEWLKKSRAAGKMDGTLFFTLVLLHLHA